MQSISLLLVYLLTFTAALPKEDPHHPLQKKSLVKGRVLYTSSYCGGAAPTDEMLQSYATPRPFNGIKLRIQKGDSHKQGMQAITVQTDDQGNFSVSLAPGNYCLAIADKNTAYEDLFLGNYTLADAECYQKWVRECDLSFEVTSDTLELPDLTLHRRCFVGSFSPCMQYNGPLPP